MLGTRFTRYLILIGVMTAMFAIVVGACGGDDESESTGVSAEELRQIVSEEVARSQQPAQPQVSMDEIGAMVEAAMSGMAEGALTADDVRSILEAGEQDALTEEQVATIVAGALEERDAMMMEARETIVFSDLNWTSAQIQNRIAQYLVEFGYNYPTDVVFGATLPLFNGLRNGDTHVTMEIWLPNQDEAWAEAQSMGQVVAIGESLGKDWQSAFVIPPTCRSSILNWTVLMT